MTPPAPPERMVGSTVVVQRVRPGDLDEVQAGIEASHPELRDWMDWAGDEPQSRETTAEWIRDREASWADGTEYGFTIRDADTDEFVGVIGLMRRIGPGGAEIGYWIRTDRTSRGAATEAAGLVTGAALDLADVDRVEIHHDEANVASGRIAEKLGYSLTERRLMEKVARAHTGVNLVWTITREAWT